jgi:pyruvate kinase
MALEWGVVPIEMSEASDVEELWHHSLEVARASGNLAPGDRVVITAGTAVNLPGTTNVIKVDVVPVAAEEP